MKQASGNDASASAPGPAAGERPSRGRESVAASVRGKSFDEGEAALVPKWSETPTGGGDGATPADGGGGTSGGRSDAAPRDGHHRRRPHHAVGSADGLFMVTNVRGPTYRGNVMAESSNDMSSAVVHPPEIALTCDVGLRPGKSLDPTQGEAKVGTIQTITSSRRVAVYADASGREVARQSVSGAGIRDDRDWSPVRGGGAESHHEAPFYGAPQPISNEVRSATVSYSDEPQMTLAATLAGGRLVRTEGSDAFVTSIAAKVGATVHHLRQFQWAVPWNVAIDAERFGVGDAVHAGAHRGEMPMAASDELPGSVMQDDTGFATLEDAMRASVPELLAALAGTNASNPGHAALIQRALRAKNPTVSLGVSLGHHDPVDSEVRVGGQVFGHPTVRPGEFSWLTVPLVQVIDLAAVRRGSKVAISVRDVHGGASGAVDWYVPFAVGELGPLAGSPFVAAIRSVG